MARSPKPWCRKDLKACYVTLDGGRLDLGPDRKAAFTRFHDLMARPEKRSVASDSVVALIDRFLKNLERHRSADAREWRRSFDAWGVCTSKAETSCLRTIEGSSRQPCQKNQQPLHFCSLPKLTLLPTFIRSAARIIKKVFSSREVQMSDPRERSGPMLLNAAGDRRLHIRITQGRAGSTHNRAAAAWEMLSQIPARWNSRTSR